MIAGQSGFGKHKVCKKVKITFLDGIGTFGDIKIPQTNHEVDIVQVWNNSKVNEATRKGNNALQ